MQITWKDLGKPDIPGQYPWRDGIVQVHVKDIEVWRDHPEAKFTLIPFQATTGPKRYLLGAADYDD